MHFMVDSLGGKVEQAAKREYGFAALNAKKQTGLFKDIGKETVTWMSHGDSIDALPKDVQEVMEGMRVEQATWTGTYMDNHVEAASTWSKNEQGVEFIELAPAEKAKWDAKLQFITDNWIKKANSKGLPGDAIVADIKAFTKKHSGQ